MDVHLLTAEGDIVGSVLMNFKYNLGYKIGYCSSYSRLSSTPPSDSKVWTVTKFPGPRLTLQCNGEMVLDFVMSDDTCGYGPWSTHWHRQMERIRFSFTDTASDFYWAALPGKLCYITCLTSYYYHTVCICLLQYHQHSPLKLDCYTAC